jgi:hypothetical protein
LTIYIGISAHLLSLDQKLMSNPFENTVICINISHTQLDICIFSCYINYQLDHIYNITTMLCTISSLFNIYIYIIPLVVPGFCGPCVGFVCTGAIVVCWFIILVCWRHVWMLFYAYTIRYLHILLLHQLSIRSYI